MYLLICYFAPVIPQKYIKYTLLHSSKFMKKVYNGGFAPEFSVSMSKETIVLVRDYVSETRE